MVPKQIAQNYQQRMQHDMLLYIDYSDTTLPHQQNRQQTANDRLGTNHLTALSIQHLSAPGDGLMGISNGQRQQQKQPQQELLAFM